jgi:hypothetical protein
MDYSTIETLPRADGFECRRLTGEYRSEQASDRRAGRSELRQAFNRAETCATELSH